MKVFLDANILVSVINKEYPVFSYSSRLLSLDDNSNVKLYTSPACLAIAFYYAQKKGRATARQKINLLAQKLNITQMDGAIVQSVIANKQIHDFEDGLQYYSAIDSGCKVIITEDKSNFYFSEIECLDSRAFMEKYVF